MILMQPEDDVKGTNLEVMEEEEDFSIKLIDLPLNGGLYTWSNMQSDLLLCRLDRVLVSPEFESKFSLLTQTVLSRTLSDHSALLLTTSNVDRKNPPFRIENHWFSNADFLANVKLWWDTMIFHGTPSYIMSKKL